MAAPQMCVTICALNSGSGHDAETARQECYFEVAQSFEGFPLPYLPGSETLTTQTA